MQIHTRWRRCTDTLPHTVLDCSRHRCPAFLSACASMLEGHVPRWNTSRSASTRNFMNEAKSVKWDRETVRPLADNVSLDVQRSRSVCSISSYMGWGFPLASHSMTMVSLGSTIWSFIDCFMIVGGCRTSGGEISQLGILETYVKRQYISQVTSCFRLLTHPPGGRQKSKHSAIKVAAALVRPVFPSL